MADGSKLAWHSDSDDEVPRPSKRFDRVVVLKGMFDAKELEEDPALLLELKEDVREEAETLGTVTSCVLYDVSSLAGGWLTSERGGRRHDYQVQGRSCCSGVCDEDEREILRQANSE